MTGQSVRGAYSLAPISPDTQEHEEAGHVCGRCRNPWTHGNPECVNNPNRRTT